MVDRIGLLFKFGWQWLTTSPRYRGALLCSLAVVGAMIAIGYNGSNGIFASPARVTHTSDVVAARISAMSAGSGARSTETSLPKDRIEDAELVEGFVVDDNFRSGKEGPSARAIASDKSFLVAETENKKAALREKDEVKKTAKKPAKKTQRRVSSERDRKFDPSREMKRAGENITRVIRDLF